MSERSTHNDTSGKQRARATKRDIISRSDIAYIIKMFIKETLLLMCLTPFRDDASATAHHTRKSFSSKHDILQSYSAMYGKIKTTIT